MSQMIQWEFVVNRITYEGDMIPSSSFEPVSKWLQDGQAFQVLPPTAAILQPQSALQELK